MTHEQRTLSPELQALADANDGFLPSYGPRGRAKWYESERGILCPNCANDPNKPTPYEHGLVVESDHIVCRDCGRVTDNGEWKMI